MAHRTLIFHFYFTPDWLSNEANKIHFSCLNEFSAIFDKAIIVICSDSLSENNKVEVVSFFTKIIHSNDITYKFVKNTLYREADTFYNNVATKLGEIDGIIFFGHNRGVGSIYYDGVSKSSILKGVAVSYYANLYAYAEDAEYSLTTEAGNKFYGVFLEKNENKIANKNHIWYAGTFYWLNPVRVFRYLESTNKTIPHICDREYAESFPGDLFDWNSGSVLCSPYSRILFNCNLYHNSEEVIAYAIGEDKYDAFNDFFKKITT